jgi:uncharacterized glyoxalase superfamily protein PhnB
MFWGWSFSMVARTRVFLHCAQKTWGRLIFYVTDVDALWNHLKERGFDPEVPRDANWGERYFHMRDPDGHELSFARPI